MPRPKICVVGASNIDLISYAPRLPKLGETVPGTRFQIGFGGKGANQAVMAAKLGGDVAIITKVGQDIFGDDIRKNFAGYTMDTTHVITTADATTGVAPIWVEESSGDNAIIVALGANDLLSPADIAAAQGALAAADIVVCQWEILTETVLAALRLAHEAGVRTIFNPAPAREQLPAETYRYTDILCPNESETELLTGMPVATQDEAVAAARVLLDRGVGTVILTLGARGSLLVTPETVQAVPAPSVRAVDTTGAGDCYVGSLAYFLAAGKPLPVAMDRASRIAAISVQAPGTQSSFPNAADLPPELLT
ncbi:MAG: ribokinase [Caldilineaceae bacterium]|nr:ribokinase [Caldilineaceae bacterium]